MSEEIPLLFGKCFSPCWVCCISVATGTATPPPCRGGARRQRYGQSRTFGGNPRGVVTVAAPSHFTGALPHPRGSSLRGHEDVPEELPALSGQPRRGPGRVAGPAVGGCPGRRVQPPCPRGVFPLAAPALRVYQADAGGVLAAGEAAAPVPAGAHHQRAVEGPVGEGGGAGPAGPLRLHPGVGRPPLGEAPEGHLPGGLPAPGSGATKVPHGGGQAGDGHRGRHQGLAGGHGLGVPGRQAPAGPPAGLHAGGRHGPPEAPAGGSLRRQEEAAAGPGGLQQQRQRRQLRLRTLAHIHSYIFFPVKRLVSLV